MQNFADLESVYNHLEEHAADYKYIFQLGKLFQEVRDLKQKENKKDDVEKAQWELEFFNFEINKNILNPKFIGTNEKGEEVKFPDINDFNDNTYKYLIGRLNSTNNPILKARYAHILWLSPRKHSKYAKIAVDSYLEIIKIFEKKDREKPEDHYGLRIRNIVNNAFCIGCQIKYRLNEIKAEIVRLIKNFNLESSSSFALRFSLIDLVLDEKRIFQSKGTGWLKKECWQLSDVLIKKGNFHGAIRMLEKGERIEEALGKASSKWRKRIAEAYESLMNQAEDGKNLAAISFCQQALESYKKIKNSKKIEELEKRYVEMKGSMKLAKFEQKLDLTDHIKKCKEIASKIVNKEQPEGIIEILMLSKDLLPKYKDMEKYANDVGENSVLFQLIPEVVMDQRGHAAQHFSEQDEKKYKRVLDMYGWEIRFNKRFLIREIFFQAINEKKLSGEILLEFFREKSWFGKSLKRKVGDEEIQYNWLSLIAPSIIEYFNIMHYFFLNPDKPPNLVLPIDSLTLKIEGLLRDMCEFSGVATFFQTRDKKRRAIVREKDLHALLYEDKIKELFDEDDLLFFKYLFVEKAGLNLRHRIAHSLLYFQEYNLDIMHLLIIALLRLGKYDFVKEDNQNGK
jgi:hypothetical protein